MAVVDPVRPDLESEAAVAGGPATRTAFRTCPLCEAGCGLEITVVRDDDGAERVTRIRGDRDDVFSHGFICPKGSTLRQLHDDPDRLRGPVVKRDGEFVEVGWDEAFAEVERVLGGAIEAHGRTAVGAYVGNPNAHNLGALLFLKPVLRALGSPNVFSASTVDQRPKEISSGLMFGAPLTVPVPDIDRTDHLLLLGANPLESNGSLATAPDWPGRLEAIRARGGRVVVVDPRRTKTAAMADEWVAIRPGTDALLLAAMAATLVEEGLVDVGPLADHLAGLEEACAALAPFTAEAVAASTGVAADEIRRLARDLAAAPSAAVYGRMGTTTAEFGTVASWLVDVLNTLTGNLDRPGGAMFTRPAAGSPTTRGAPGVGRGLRLGSRHSRVRGLAESLGELPVSCLAEEIDTPGEGQIRALVTIAGNPVCSTPNSERLDAALDGLDAMVSVDIYINETTRHADVILPVPSALEKPHYDLALLQLAIRNVANWSEPILRRDEGTPDEWEVLSRLALVLQGMAATADPAVVEGLVLDALLAGAVGDEHGPVHGRDPAELKAALGDEPGPARILDLMLRVGPYGDAFGDRPDGLTLERLREAPHGIDLGPLAPRLPEVLRTPSGKVELAPDVVLADLPRLAEALARPVDETDLRLVGRRDVRSNNSWMHNVEVLVKGKARCTLHVHPDDADRLGLVDGAEATVTSRVGAVTAPVQVTDAIRPGVVSLPHGWGHDRPGVQMGVAGRHAGVNSNVLTDDAVVDAVSGNAVLNGIPVEVAPA
ncbi:molybdopterin-dependent oxidoreductase [Iamia sp. SCSIO 61187]|uniref:molybdopterin-dependent oxidoreductase n=1 Tax=Iamia sp. SCSIO 61187 TaxID=2722752 RepID=UPI001C634744|nr:molybdopterin-dependent oxidoreductase [Iamia sp. SCSIO 61187]QYG92688.1 molybdopterin-dependent oxidoreductase [Iamia sp. SCSIO 61187]